jgi:hypothetical protein
VAVYTILTLVRRQEGGSVPAGSAPARVS